jgi:hypothetical protein
METTKLELAKNYCKDYKLKLNDFNDNGFFIASKKHIQMYIKIILQVKKKKLTAKM